MTSSAKIPTEPFSDDHGFANGTPLDRYYIKAFLYDRRQLVHGSVLEVVKRPGFGDCSAYWVTTVGVVGVG